MDNQNQELLDFEDGILLCPIMVAVYQAKNHIDMILEAGHLQAYCMCLIDHCPCWSNVNKRCGIFNG